MGKNVKVLVLKVRPEDEEVAMSTLMYKRAKAEVLSWFWTAKSRTYTVLCLEQCARDMNSNAWAIL